MALQYISDGSGKVAIGYDSSTGERGFLIRMNNKTGATTVKGSLVAASTATTNSFVLQSSEFDTFGIVYESGVADGSEAWIWVNGSIAQCLLKDTETTTMGYVAIAADTDGRFMSVAVPSANPVVAEHFKEIGHVLETKSSGTNVLCLVHLHFN